MPTVPTHLFQESPYSHLLVATKDQTQDTDEHLGEVSLVWEPESPSVMASVSVALENALQYV